MNKLKSIEINGKIQTEIIYDIKYDDACRIIQNIVNNDNESISDDKYITVSNNTLAIEKEKTKQLELEVKKLELQIELKKISK